jgi:hypothetical protein
VCTVALSAVPIFWPWSSSKMTSSEVFIVFSRYSARVKFWNDRVVVVPDSLANKMAKNSWQRTHCGG